jgi:alpha-1,6-mannosyltransferase
VRRGAIFALAGGGFLLAVAVVVAWGRLGPGPGSRNPTGWLGLLAVLAPDDASKAHLLFLLVPALLLLLGCWWQLMRLTANRQLTTRATTVLAACWAFPFTVGPIIGSRDAYAYVAQGELARRGFDPARSVVSQLPAGPLLAAVDPRWRDTRPPYGGVAIAIEKAAAAAGGPDAALVTLRVVAVVSVALLVAVTARMASPSQRPLVIAAIAANPLVLVHLVGGAHLDAVAAAFLVCGLAIAWNRAPARSRPTHAATHARSQARVSRSRHLLGVILCTLGAMVKLPVGLGAAYLLVCGFVAAGPTLASRLRSVAADLVAVAAGIGLSTLVSGTGLGWLRNFGTPGHLRTGIAPADLAAHLVSGLGWLVGLHPAAGSVLDGTRLVAAVAGGLLATALLLPRLQRETSVLQWTPPTLDQLALALLALALLGPVFYAWYLAPALPLLALAASRVPTAGYPADPSAGRSGDLSPLTACAVILVASVLLVVVTMPSLTPAWHTLGLGH